MNNLVEQLRIEQSNTRVILQSIKRGDVYKQKANVIARNEAIEKLVNNYSSKDISNFINDLSDLLLES